MKKDARRQAKRLNSPRQLRALIALQQGPQTVRSLQDRAGGNTIPELVAALRRKGLVILTEERCGQDRDGRTAVSYTHLTLPTIYSV